MKNDICVLITRTASGSEVTESKKQIWCEKKSCTRSEHYAAYAVGLQPKFILIISSLDYETCSVLIGEERIYPTQVLYHGAIYAVLRVYEEGVGVMELTIG